MRKSNEQHIRQVLRQAFGKGRFSQKMNEASLRINWNEMMGPAIANHTSDIQLKGNTLILRIDSAPLREELRFSAAKLMERVNEELGEEAVLKLEIY